MSKISSFGIEIRERTDTNCTNPDLNTRESRAYITKYRTVTIEQ